MKIDINFVYMSINFARFESVLTGPGSVREIALATLFFFLVCVCPLVPLGVVEKWRRRLVTQWEAT